MKGTFLKKKFNEKVTYIDVVNETDICFFLSLRFGIQFGWRSVLKTTYKCQILFSATRVVDNMTAIIFKNLKCERISEVKSTFSAVVLVLLFGVLVNAIEKVNAKQSCKLWNVFSNCRNPNTVRQSLERNLKQAYDVIINH